MHARRLLQGEPGAPTCGFPQGLGLMWNGPRLVAGRSQAPTQLVFNPERETGGVREPRLVISHPNHSNSVRIGAKRVPVPNTATSRSGNHLLD